MLTGNISTDDSLINSQLSFRPLLAALKKNIQASNPGVQKLYAQLLSEFESNPELSGNIADTSVILSHTGLIEGLLASIFPPTAAAHERLYAVALPFKFKTVYSSRLFHHLFMKPGTNEINVPDNENGKTLSYEKTQFACGMILKKYCGYNHPETTGWVHAYTDQHTGLIKYLELKIDARFIDVNPIGEMPPLPDSIICQDTNRIKSIDELMEQIPLDKFIFEGISIVKINDVTDRENISRIKSTLIKINGIADESVFSAMEKDTQSLIGIKDLKIGVTPFFRINGHYVNSDLYNNNSILFKHFHSAKERDEVSDSCKILFRDSDQPVIFETLDEKRLTDAEYLQYYYKEGGRSLIICPLKAHDELIGILEIMSDNPGKLKHTHISKIEPAIPLFTLGLEKGLQSLDTQIDRVIKEKFTAVQPAVEWKFTEAALNYIMNSQQNTEAKIERIAFQDVYPLYGAIDIRNSSTERSHAIQLDMIEQLELAQKVVAKAQADMSFPLLKEIEFKINKYMASASDVLLSDEEINIQEFLQGQVTPVFNLLRSTQPSLSNEVENYFSSLDPQLNMLYHHRREYEQSISKINDTLARFIDKEQAAAQKVYPHFFERYVTDGLDFNIYMGQSITPRRKFDEIYLRNLKMWQLTVLAKAARLTHNLGQQLSHSLHTTQLILSYSVPLSISFRTSEKKFDADGAYNIRYEIVKKRIDKVRIKSTNERLTQPGKIAIVYSQAKDADEYLEYIEFLQSQGLLKSGVEKLDLEELQGVIGLKALRVEVNFNADNKPDQKAELSKTTLQELLGN